MGTIRVAVLGDPLPEADGVSKTVASLLRPLTRCGIEIEVWRLTISTEITEHRFKGVKVFDLPAHPRPRNFLLGLPKKSMDFLRSRAPAIDLIHSHSVFTPEHPYITEKLRRPYVVTPNGGYSAEVVKGRRRGMKAIWLILREQHYLQGATFVHVVSRREEADIKSVCPGARTVFAPNGVTVPSEPLEYRGDPNAIVFLGRLAIEHKGLDLLIRGYAEYLRNVEDHGSSLTLAGPDFRGGTRRAQAIAEAEGIASRVSFPGPLYGDDKTDLLMHTGLFAHTSRWEGLPLAVLEALACARPVLVTPETNLSHAVAEARAGLVVEANQNAIARGFQVFFELSMDERVQMSRRARQLVEDSHSWERTAAILAEAYKTGSAAPRIGFQQRSR